MQVVLIGAARDHPPGTHEYLAGLRVIGACLEKQPDLEVVSIHADEPDQPWEQHLAAADVIVGFFYGQRVHAQAELRRAIDQRLRRGAGLVLLHRSLQGDGEAGRWIQRSVGAYHGEQDRKYQTVETLFGIAAGHPVSRGVKDFRVRDELYYQLKFLPGAKHVVPIAQAEIDGTTHTVAWAWQRPDSGRSFGFSGCHFHANFARAEYRRLIVQAILWAGGRELPDSGVSVDVGTDVLTLPDPPGAP